MKNKNVLSVLKSEKGVTLLGLIVYVTTFICVTALVGVVSNFFYSNTSVLDETTADASQFTKLQLYIANEFETKRSTVVDTTLDDSIADEYEFIEFSSGNKLIYHQGYIFYNKINICNNVQDFKVKIEPAANNKSVLKIYIVFGNMSYTTEFAMSN